MVNIMAYGEPDEDAKTYILYSLRNEKISRFLYSWIDNCDLNRLAEIPTNQMTADEKEIWRRGKRLLNLKAGDYILHKHVPERGKVTAVRICSKYFYDANPKPINAAGRRDGRHCFRVDKIFEFRRDAVHPQLQTKLKVMGALYAIPDVKEFFESMQSLGMPFDESDRVAAAEAGVILKDSGTSTDNDFLPPIIPVVQRERNLNSPLQKISSIRENYLNELLKVLRNLSSDDPLRNEVLTNAFEALRMFSSDALKKMVEGLFIRNGYSLIDADDLGFTFEIFSRSNLVRDLYTTNAIPRIFVCIKNHGDTYEKIFAQLNGVENIQTRFLIAPAEQFDEKIAESAKEAGVILIDGLTFVNILARHKI